MSKISNKLSMLFSSEIELKDFSFSQLIMAVKSLFDTEGIPGFVRALVILIEALVIKKAQCPHCNSEKHHQHGKSSRILKTTIGEVNLIFSRVQCLNCKRTFVPMLKLIDINKFSRKSRDYEKVSLETVTNQSFRRSAKNLKDTLGVETAHTTLHRWFQNTESTELDVKKRVDYLIADGTGFKKEKKDKNDSNKGSIKVMIGYNKNGEVIPFGAWTRASWQDIGRFIKNENHPSDKIKFKPIAGTLITDGEEELVRRLKKLAIEHQRCLFHMTHELTPLLRYKDMVGKDEAIKISKELDEILYLELPSQDADPLKSLEDKLKIETKLLDMEKAIDGFIEELKVMGYKKAKTFVENAKGQLFTYINNWLKTGISNPKVTSLVERIMREIKRRIKRMGYKWSEKGAEKMTRLILLQLSSTKHFWETYWQEKMGINANIKLSFLGVKVEA